MHTCIYTHALSRRLRAYAYIRICVYAYMCIYVRAYAYAPMRICVYTHIHAYTHTYIHTYMHTCIYTHAPNPKHQILNPTPVYMCRVVYCLYMLSGMLSVYVVWSVSSFFFFYSQP